MSLFASSDARDSNMNRMLLCVDAVASIALFTTVYSLCAHVMSRLRSALHEIMWRNSISFQLHDNWADFFFFSLMCLGGCQSLPHDIKRITFCYKTTTSLSSGVHHVFCVDHIASLLHASRIRHFNLFICLHTLVVRQRFVFLCRVSRETEGKKYNEK